jgi:hypothetical protein
MSTSDHTTLIHYSPSQSQSLIYSLEADFTENNPIVYQWMFTTVACCTRYLATGCLPRISAEAVYQAVAYQRFYMSQYFSSISYVPHVPSILSFLIHSSSFYFASNRFMGMFERCILSIQRSALMSLYEDVWTLHTLDTEIAVNVALWGCLSAACSLYRDRRQITCLREKIFGSWDTESLAFLSRGLGGGEWLDLVPSFVSGRTAVPSLT